MRSMRFMHDSKFSVWQMWKEGSISFEWKNHEKVEHVNSEDRLDIHMLWDPWDPCRSQSLSVTNMGRNVAFGLNGRIMRSWACTVRIMSVWRMWNKPWRDYGLNSHMESEHMQSDGFHVLSVEMGTWISASWVITWIECVQSEDFLDNICKKNFVRIDELKIHMKRKCAAR